LLARIFGADLNFKAQLFSSLWPRPIFALLLLVPSPTRFFCTKKAISTVMIVALPYFKVTANTSGD
jgi:hypothetical protein